MASRRFTYKLLARSQFEPEFVRVGDEGLSVQNTAVGVTLRVGRAQLPTVELRDVADLQPR
eukprot:6183118-Pleurochrysis_carterae.AAC.1